MPTKRGWAAFAAGLGLWVTARLIGSRDLHMIAAGVAALPFLAILFVRWSNPRLDVHRHLSAVRGFPGSRVHTTLTLENRGRVTTSFLLLEDTLPSALGKPARMVVTGVPPRCTQKVSYTIHCRHRGVYTVGPLVVYLSDPFGLARTRVQAGSESELIVYPEVEDIEAKGLVVQGAGTGEAAVRRLHRSAAEFYTMRAYVTGDDLRRIHWPSVARTGELMIRQDESTRRSSATVFLDTRAAVLGPHGSPGFERAVSMAATIGRALSRAGYSLRLGTVETPPTSVSEEVLLETLASTVPSRAKAVVPALTGLRTSALADTTLVVVTAPPLATEIAVMSRVGTGFGRRLALLVYPSPLASMAVEVAAELEGRATVARASLQRAGWDVYLIHADGKLAETWHVTRKTKLQVTGTPS